MAQRIGAAGGHEQSGQRRYAIGLYRVSTAEQGHSGLGLEAQRASVRAYVAAQGWTLVAEHEDVASGKDDRRPGFQAAWHAAGSWARCWWRRGWIAITRRAHTLSQLLEEGVAIRAADMPGADELMLRIYAAMAQKERELISERTRAALAAAKARGAVLGGDRGWRPAQGPDAARASQTRREAAQRAAHRLVLEVERLQGEGITSQASLARALTASRVAHTARGSDLDPHHRGAGGGPCCRNGAAAAIIARMTSPPS
jgi:DNA invertase Pin-like site-specific DNA recombinase